MKIKFCFEFFYLIISILKILKEELVQILDIQK